MGAIVSQATDATLATAALPANRDEAQHQIQAATVEELEQFIQAYPESVWVPSLRANLGKHYRNIGRYTLALEHWGASWEALKGATDGPAKAEADYVLAHYARLLAEFCRLDALGLLLEETQGRVLDRGPLSQMMGRTREAYTIMRLNPSVAYRCGNLALHRLAASLEAPGYQPRNVLMAPAASFGLSMAMMVELARAGGLDVVAVERIPGEEVPVPCIVHFSQNHYATVVAVEGGRYKVEDPSFRQTHYYEPEAFYAEASGVFLVPRQALSADYRELSTTEAAGVWGRSLPNIVPDDAGDQGCPDGSCSCPAGTGGGGNGGSNGSNGASGSAGCNGGAGGGTGAGGGGGGGGITIDDGRHVGQPGGGRPSSPGGGGGGSGGGSGGGGLIGTGTCPANSTCSSGMPAWRVSEPFINLWIDDTPLAYQPAKGPAVEFTLSYLNPASKRIREADLGLC